jgi:hypothetical protein
MESKRKTRECYSNTTQKVKFTVSPKSSEQFKSKQARPSFPRSKDNTTTLSVSVPWKFIFQVFVVAFTGRSGLKLKFRVIEVLTKNSSNKLKSKFIQRSDICKVPIK